MKYFLPAIVLLGLLFSCSGTQKSAASIAQLDALVRSKNLEIRSNWAAPMLSRGVMAISNSGLLMPGSTAGRIDIIGNANFIKIQGDTLSAYLPYYGERQMGGGYARNSGIEFKGIPTTYEVTQNEPKKTYTIRFTISESTENYQVFINIGTDLATTVSINSSQRDAINYYGNARPIKE
ncbi:DUF4251 domain-containing protein [Arenibacter sp. GZD96]|uniref:DUF4251 domain-containing protein n=1 Tax=Aurantibrevibacter litoralis TaxID=3106030 RepID=UPI002AFEF7D9|nr:DUF4251 domain-containing protein [Arenibacter sp. GZD-96]MEA1786382.1 DUF4251 domain-containing protein [Arenibacter sp. GZD-96]